jgi:hypothetical protein
MIDKENAWKYPKFHELLHIVDDMSCIGSPLNFCAQGPESLLKDVVKHPGRRTQKRHEGSAYKLQCAQCLMYSVVIDTVHTCIWDTEDRENSSTGGSNDELVDSTNNTNEIYQGTKKPHVDVFEESNQATKCSMKSSGTPEHSVI